MNIKNFFKDFWNVLKYILKDFYDSFKNVFNSISKPKTLFFVLMVVLLIQIIFKKGTSMIKITMVLLILVYIWKEWLAGDWKHTVREKYM